MPGHLPSYTKGNRKTFATKEDAVRAAEKFIRGKAVAEWPYRDADGRVVFYIVRFNLASGCEGKPTKQFRPFHESAKGWVIADPPGRLPLYRLNELPKTGRIYVCEGEACADAFWKLGIPATTSAHGAQSPEKTDWSPLFGRDVVIVPDNDEAGEEYARKVAAILLRGGQ